MINGQFYWRVRLLYHLISKMIVDNDNVRAHIMRLVNEKYLY